MRKFLLLVLVSLTSVCSNAQNVHQSTGGTEAWKSHYTGQFDFFVQDGWGVGLTLRKEINPYIGWNIIGASFMSGWGTYETPDNFGIVNARMMGIRATLPIMNKFAIFADVTPGYTYMYFNAPVYSGWYGGMRSAKAHCFGMDCNVGILLGKHLALGYNLSFYTNKKGDSHVHWGRVSLIF